MGRGALSLDGYVGGNTAQRHVDPAVTYPLPGHVLVDLRTREVVIDLGGAAETPPPPNGATAGIQLVDAPSAGPSVNLGTQVGREWAKRVLDLALVTVTAPLWLMVLGLLVAVVKCSSRGPTFYVQERVGRFGKTIRCRKLRTMVHDADRRLPEVLASDLDLRREFEATFKLRRDPRVTRVGRVLRVTGLDELPQLLAVVTGTMSLVGPRPITAQETRFYGPYLPIAESVRPGLTGLWQVSGRNDIPYPFRVAYDVQYALTRTVWSDVKIMGRTILLVFRASRRGAY